RSYLLSVRPETSFSSNRLSLPSSGRSTFCSIIAQLTEETQPLFETTLKSRAVSEDSDVRFTCIVTGYPEPEVTWYKDDQQLDRYCGLPKYEITHQGNRHTLQLYRCQEEDAAIYQASARNTKGIVSCSGVLEVGTMTEYKIHQRWFAKLKRKAAAKMREIEQSWKPRKEAAGDADALRKLSPDRFQPPTAPEGAAREGYFSLKDLYLESTRGGRPPGEQGPHTPRGRAPGELSSGKAPCKAGGERAPTGPGQPAASAPQPARPFNRRRFAPPKPGGEPAASGEPESAPGQAPEASGKASAQASAQVPTPPARRRHSTRDSPLQGQGGPRTPGEVPESPEKPAPAMPASSSAGTASAGHSSSRSQGAIEPMDTETHADQRTASADQQPGGKKNTETDGKMQVARRTQRTQADREPQVGTALQDGERTASARSSQDAAVAPGRAGAQEERTQAERKTQADEKTQADRRTQEDKGTQSEGSRATATEGQSEQGSVTSLSPQARPPGRPPSEGPQSPPITEGFEQTPEGSSLPEDPGFVLRSEEAAVTAPRSYETAVLGTPAGGPELQAQWPPQGGSEQPGGVRHQGLEWSGLGRGKPEDGLIPCPKEEQLGTVLSVGVGGCPPARRSPEAPSLPGPGLTQSPQEVLPSTQCISATAFTPSGDQAVLRSAPPLHLGPGTPAQSPPQATAAAGSEGAHAQGPDVEGRPPGPRSCDPGLIDSLKNYLLLLLKLSSTDAGGGGTGSQEGPASGAPMPSSTLAPHVEVAGLSPRTSRRILERVENNHLVQSAQTLLLSPCTSRRLTGLLDREVQAGRQALAAARGPLTVPAIVVGEGELSLEGPGLLGASRDSGVGGPPGGAVGHVASGQGPLSADRGAQEATREEEAPGEALTGLPAATPEELALGARRKRFLPKVRAVGDGEAAKPEERESPTVSPRGPRKGLAPGSPGTPGREKRSPTQGRKAGLLEVPRAEEEPVAGELGSSPKAGGLDTELALDEGKQDALGKARKAKELLKAPQVIRKIRVEQFPDASGSLKLWCQFFNILSDSVLTWAKDQRPVGEVGRSAGDEGPAALAIVQASPVDCGVYRCTIHNEHGSASTDFCLSPEVLSGFISREEGEVGEEIEMTPMVFAKGLADSGCWGDKLFGRLVSEELRGSGHGYGLRKASQAKVIYGLEPIFESGRTCVIKVSSLLVFGPSSETSLLGRNYDVTIQGCKIQNMSREYCKIFAAEAQAAPGFGEVPEILPLYLIYRPANNIPYATLEEDLGAPLQPCCSREWGCAAPPEAAGRAEVRQKCQTFQHWLYLWTNGSFLVTDLAGVDWKMTDVQIATKLRGYQGLKESCFPALLDQFAASHQCNAFCEMLGLKPLKGPEAAHPQAKAKGSKSPSTGRKGSQLSPQPQKKGPPSPQGTRKNTPSSKAPPQASEALTAQFLGQPPIQEGGPKAQGMR
ncbi:alpha-protein kinase 3, partial [Suricata suricatta]